MLLITFNMKILILCVCFIFKYVLSNSNNYMNITLEPAARQLLNFKLQNTGPNGLLTTSAGCPVDIRDTVTVNSDSLDNQFNLDLITHLDAERIPERFVHAKGTGAFGYFEVTNDVSKYTVADVFNGVGKKTPLVARLSIAVQSTGGNDLARSNKGLAVKFYTKAGNLDILCLHLPVFFFKDPLNFVLFSHAFKKNPKTHVFDNTMRWDLMTLKPDFLHAFFWLASDYGITNGYRTMDAFAIHTFEIYNNEKARYYVRFNFRTEVGLQNLTTAQAQAISGSDLDYFTRDLYNAIENKTYPSWLLEMDVLSLHDLKNIDYDPFDTTNLWKNGTYHTVPIGRVVLNKNPDNQFKDIEQSAFNPGNLVPGITGSPDEMFKARRLSYRDTQNYRLGINHNKIEVNYPKSENTYNRDGVPPARDNMKDAPNYYPNSFSGPVPTVDVFRPKEKMKILQSTAMDLNPAAYFYNKILVNEAQRQRLIENIIASLVTVTNPVLDRAIKILALIDSDLGKRVVSGLAVNDGNKRR